VDALMTERRTVFLMYHELEEPGRPLCQTDPGYVRYVLPSSEFRAQMQFLKSNGWRGVTVSEALRHQPENVAITFDDGCETDFICAAPVLEELGFGATFYGTTGFIGKSGYLNQSQLRELCSLGFDIGCHSMTHTYLTDLDEKGVYHEIAEAKSQLEQMICNPVEHFSCPGGRHNERISEVARRAGYRTVATSRMHANSASSNRLALGRVPMMRATSLTTFGNLCRGQGLWPLNLFVHLREVIRMLLGNSVYDRLRHALLRHRPPQ
jgi:peptidoglycan/xylan/chitin deacetylase (PgdA/CDA1 family)